jgi:hypothetical protein
MRLAELEQVRGGKRPAFRAPLEAGDGRYELVISGPPAVVKKAFAKAEIEVEADAKATPKSWNAEAAKRLGEHGIPDGIGLADLEAGLAKKAYPAPTPATSILASLRRLEGEGTTFSFSIMGLFLPAGLSLFFGLPLVCTCFGLVAPKTGDQDILLHLGWPPIGPVRISAKGGTAVDVVTFASPCTPFTQFVPIFQIFGWTTGTCGTFAVGGADFLG